MTERKPPEKTFESWIEKQIREATERGEFDNLRGMGKPIPGVGTQYDEDWWLKAYLRREGVSGDALLPPALVLRRDIERLPETLRDLTSEREVREVVAELNRRVVEWLRMPQGPFVPIAPVNADAAIAQWRAERTTQTRRSQPYTATPAPARPERRWWWRRRRKRGSAG